MPDNQKQTLEEQLFFSGSAYFEAMLRDINCAQNSIELETYIFYPDKLGEKFISALSAAARRGVAVRVLLDGAGSRKRDDQIASALEDAGVQARVFHPFPWSLWQWSRSKVRVPFILKAIYLLLKINSRNHRKVCITDNKVVYVGSFNICRQHLEKELDGGGWRDTAVRLSNLDISELNIAFEAAWSHMPIQDRVKQIFRHVQRNPVIRLNHTRHRRRILYKDLLNRIAKTKRRIWITNAYFVPDNFLLRKLNDVATAGVDVRILLPRNSDVVFIPWASNAFYERLLKAGVRIFEYLPTMLHAKTLILDDWMLVGSSNLNHRSLLHDLEVDVNISQPKSCEALEKQFLSDLTCAKEIKLDNWEKLPLHQRIFGRLVLYLKYLI